MVFRQQDRKMMRLFYMYLRSGIQNYRRQESKLSKRNTGAHVYEQQSSAHGTGDPKYNYIRHGHGKYIAIALP